MSEINENKSAQTSQYVDPRSKALHAFVWLAVGAGVGISILVGFAQTPIEPNFTYYLMLLYGALFYYQWKRAGRVPRTGGFVGALVGLLIATLCSFFSGLLRS